LAALLTVKHSIEVAHRLSQTPGKCENIHGHSMIVELSIRGNIGPAGLLIPNPDAILVNANKDPLEFGELKSWFRGILDDKMDHKLLLNENDPWLQDIGISAVGVPGLAKLEGDPTTENIAKWVYEAAYRQYIQMELQPVAGRSMMHVTIYETAVNSATYGDF
jgi:6-pyruvoyltetrahydropterin/6-carboxytetrahydropterin synthase